MIEHDAAGTEFRHIQYNYMAGTARKCFSGILKLDRQALENLAADPAAETLEGKDLYEALREKGAVQNDGMDANGAVIPAGRIFAIQDGGQKHIEQQFHCQNDLLHDPDAATGAYQIFHETGEPATVMHFKEGKPIYVGQKPLTRMDFRLN
jgi:hypothetical protein